MKLRVRQEESFDNAAGGLFEQGRQGRELLGRVFDDAYHLVNGERHSSPFQSERDESLEKYCLVLIAPKQSDKIDHRN